MQLGNKREARGRHQKYHQRVEGKKENREKRQKQGKEENKSHLYNGVTKDKEMREGRERTAREMKRPWRSNGMKSWAGTSKEEK